MKTAPSNSATRLYRERFVTEPRTELRLSEKSMSTPSETIITQELVVLDNFSGKVVSLMIWSENVTEGFICHFNIL